MTMTIHAHVDTYSTDCDGPISRSYVMVPNEDERAEHERAQGINDFSDIHFHERVVNALVNTYSIFQGGKLEVTSGEGSDYIAMLDWHEQTEEGFHSAHAVICDDESCDTGEESYRDHYAEMMGY